MCIYCCTNNYRKIYESHYGLIPKDNDGRTFEIHHIDGNHSNSDPQNLAVVSIQEHYNIHFSQGDWAACLIMAKRMKIPPDEKTKLAKLSNEKRLLEGTHPFLGGDIQSKNNKKRVKDGTHHLLSGEIQRKTQLAKSKNGTHNFIGNGELQTKNNNIRVQNGTHHFLGGELQRQNVKKQLENGTHNFLGGVVQKQSALKRLKNGTHPSQQKKECEFCKKIVDSANFSRWHGNKCKNKI